MEDKKENNLICINEFTLPNESTNDNDDVKIHELINSVFKINLKNQK